MPRGRSAPTHPTRRLSPAPADLPRASLVWEKSGGRHTGFSDGGRRGYYDQTDRGAAADCPLIAVAPCSRHGPDCCRPVCVPPLVPRGPPVVPRGPPAVPRGPPAVPHGPPVVHSVIGRRSRHGVGPAGGVAVARGCWHFCPPRPPLYLIRLDPAGAAGPTSHVSFYRLTKLFVSMYFLCELVVARPRVSRWLGEL